MTKFIVLTLLFLSIILCLSHQTLAAINTTYWTAGVEYNSINTTANSIAATMQIPSSTPASGYYYVILSVWDSAGSYDQIGFQDQFGTWTSIYSWSNWIGTPPLKPQYKSWSDSPYSSIGNADSISLSPGATYIFRISIKSGNVTYIISGSKNSTVLWSKTIYTGGNVLNIDAINYHNSSGSQIGSPGYTVYEEVHFETGSSPQYNFSFYNSNWTATNGMRGHMSNDSITFHRICIIDVCTWRLSLPWK